MVVPIHSRFIAWGAVAGAVVAVVSALALVGLKPPQPLWASDLEPLVAQVQNLDRRVTEQDLAATLRAIYQNLALQEGASEGLKTKLLIDQANLEAERLRLERALDQMPRS